MAERVDVVVVGAGLAGLSCARVVSEAGLTCTLLEASDGVWAGEFEPTEPTGTSWTEDSRSC